MLEYSRTKFIIAALVTVLGLLYALPNLFPADHAIQISANRGATVDAALEERVKGVLETQDIAAKAVELNTETGRLLVRLANADVQLAAQRELRRQLGDNYNVALNLASTVPAWLAAIGGKPMTLGLDLQGGVHFLMEVDRKDSIDKEITRLVDDARSLLRQAGIVYRAVNGTPNGLSMSFRTVEDRDAALVILRRDLPVLEYLVGPVTEGSVAVTARLSETELTAAMNAALQQNISTLRNRINALGVTEPVIQQQGASRIVVQLPGVQDTAAAKRMLSATATLEYRAVDMQGNVLDALEGRVPPASKLYYTRDGRPVLLSKRVIATGDQLIDAASGFDSESGSPMVSVTLNNVGARSMQAFTNENVGNDMAVVFIERVPETTLVDGVEQRTTRIKEEVISIATVREPFGKRFQTTGLDSPQEAAELAVLLKAGALAAPIEIVEERVVGPSLGADNIRAGWLAVSFSFLFVLVFFVVYYKVFGVITNLALLLNLVLVVAVMSILDATITLPGLAGLALTVGLSVDANVLINERIREELRAGNTPLGAIAAGFDKATGTIADANITALLAGIALFAFGAGPIKGFAITLCVGILTSMYTAVSVARGIATLFYGRRRKLAGLAI